MHSFASLFLDVEINRYMGKIAMIFFQLPLLE
jgi:hypothetical protein